MRYHYETKGYLELHVLLQLIWLVPFILGEMAMIQTDTLAM